MSAEPLRKPTRPGTAVPPQLTTLTNPQRGGIFVGLRCVKQTHHHHPSTTPPTTCSGVAYSSGCGVRPGTQAETVSSSMPCISGESRDSRVG